jgi:hypothetical protein
MARGENSEDEEEIRRRARRASSVVSPWMLPPWRIYAGYGPAGWTAQATPPVNPDQFGFGEEPEDVGGVDGGDGVGDGGGMTGGV